MRICLVSLWVWSALALGDQGFSDWDQLFLQRDEPATAQKLDRRLDELLRSSSGGDFEVLWRAAEWKHWQADGAPDPEIKKRLAKEAWALAERAVEKAPDRVEGHYFAAVGIGSYSQAVGILSALSQGLEGKFNRHLDRAIELDPSFKHGASWVVKGRYYYELPWPKRDLDRSVTFLKKAIEEHPENLRSYVFLAETELKQGHPELAKQSIDAVFAGSEQYDPPEARRCRALAEKLKAKIE